MKVTTVLTRLELVVAVITCMALPSWAGAACDGADRSASRSNVVLKVPVNRLEPGWRLLGRQGERVAVAGLSDAWAYANESTSVRHWVLRVDWQVYHQPRLDDVDAAQLFFDKEAASEPRLCRLELPEALMDHKTLEDWRRLYPGTEVTERAKRWVLQFAYDPQGRLKTVQTSRADRKSTAVTTVCIQRDAVSSHVQSVSQVAGQDCRVAGTAVVTQQHVHDAQGRLLRIVDASNVPDRREPRVRVFDETGAERAAYFFDPQNAQPFRVAVVPASTPCRSSDLLAWALSTERGRSDDQFSQSFVESSRSNDLIARAPSMERVVVIGAAARPFVWKESGAPASPLQAWQVIDRSASTEKVMAKGKTGPDGLVKLGANVHAKVRTALQQPGACVHLVTGMGFRVDLVPEAPAAEWRACNDLKETRPGQCR